METVKLKLVNIIVIVVIVTHARLRNGVKSPFLSSFFIPFRLLFFTCPLGFRELSIIAVAPTVRGDMGAYIGSAKAEIKALAEGILDKYGFDVTAVAKIKKPRKK
ncbi:MAG: hypothetical protein IKP75_04705 [Oscillospiraceae bacterium]|nr:hypothetical protein [Oscillospiraceae bacterium]